MQTWGKGKKKLHAASCIRQRADTRCKRIQAKAKSSKPKAKYSFTLQAERQKPKAEYSCTGFPVSKGPGYNFRFTGA